MKTFDQVFRESSLYDVGFENDKEKYFTYRQTKQITRALIAEVMTKIEDNTYYDCNTGQCCFSTDFNLDDLQKFVEQLLNSRDGDL